MQTKIAPEPLPTGYAIRVASTELFIARLALFTLASDVASNRQAAAAATMAGWVGAVATGEFSKSCSGREPPPPPRQAPPTFQSLAASPVVLTARLALVSLSPIWALCAAALVVEVGSSMNSIRVEWSEEES